MTRDKSPKPPKVLLPPTPVEQAVAAIGSVGSLVLHTIVFVAFFIAASLGVIAWELMLLVLTTLVSLEAIYLALLIQITVNRHTESLREVEEELDELGEDVEDIQEDIEEISEDIDEIQEDVEEWSEEDEKERVRAERTKSKGEIPTAAEALEQLTRDVARVLEDLEALKKSK